MKASDLRGILGYMAGFRDKLFVLNIDSAVMVTDNFHNLLLDVSVLRSLNIDVVIVHGASQRVKTLSAEMNIPASDIDGMGITDEKTLRLAILASNLFAHEILEGLSETDLRASVTNAIVAHPAGIIGGRDFQWTGKVEKVDTAFLKSLLEDGIIPVIPPLGFDGNGQTYRVNSDQVALEVSEALGAHKLMFVTTSNGVSGGGKLSTQFSVAEAEDVLKKRKGELPPDMISKLQHGLRACKNGVLRAHIIDGRQDEALLGEIFSNEGVGTMIYANEYQAIRRALKKDAGVIHGLIRSAIGAQEIVARTRREIADRVGDFYVFEIDRNVVGCVGLRTYPGGENGVVELECLYVADAHENQGIGRKLMQFAEDKARELGLKRILALSTQAFNFFQQKGGFKDGDVTMLPEERRRKYEQSGRKSKILFKDLG